MIIQATVGAFLDLAPWSPTEQTPSPVKERKKRKGRKLPNFLRESEADKILAVCREQIDKTLELPTIKNTTNAATGNWYQRQRAIQAYGHVAPLVRELNSQGLTLQAVADELNSRGLRTRGGALWGFSQVARVLERRYGLCNSKLKAARADELIVHIGLFLGLRVSEIRNLSIEHLDLERRMCFVSQGKGSKDRYVPIPLGLVKLLRERIGDRKNGPLLMTRWGKRFPVITIQHRLCRLGKLAGLQRKLKPHTLRHSYAVRLIETGAGIHEVRDLLGHSDLSQTSIYLTCSPERLQAAADRLTIRRPAHE